MINISFNLFWIIKLLKNIINVLLFIERDKVTKFKFFKNEKYNSNNAFNYSKDFDVKQISDNELNSNISKIKINDLNYKILNVRSVT